MADLAADPLDWDHLGFQDLGFEPLLQNTTNAIYDKHNIEKSLKSSNLSKSIEISSKIQWKGTPNSILCVIVA